MYQSTKDMKSLNFCSIYKESFNIISSNTKLFTRIAIFFAFPLYIISVFIATQLPNLIPQQSINQLNTTNIPSTHDNTNRSTTAISSWMFASFLIYILAFAVLMGLSLFTFTSIAYSVACICTDHDNITVKTMTCAFKKAWMKLLLTRLLQLAVIVGYSLVTGLAILVLEVWFITPTTPPYETLVALLVVLIVLLAFNGVMIYISVYWIFGSVVAVLESSYGFEALSKSKSLVKGKAFLTIRVLFSISLLGLLLGWMFTKVVVNGDLIGLGLVTRIGCGVVGLPVVVVFSVFSVVVQIVTYLVCKADKGERITKSNVMDHLDI